MSNDTVVSLADVVTRRPSCQQRARIGTARLHATFFMLSSPAFDSPTAAVGGAHAVPSVGRIRRNMYPQVRNVVKSESNRLDRLGRRPPPNGRPGDATPR